MHGDLLDQVDMLRLNLSGFSIDREMMILISRRQAYTVAASLLQIADDVMRELLDVL